MKGLTSSFHLISMFLNNRIVRDTELMFEIKDRKYVKKDYSIIGCHLGPYPKENK